LEFYSSLQWLRPWSGTLLLKDYPRFGWKSDRGSPASFFRRESVFPFAPTSSSPFSGSRSPSARAKRSTPVASRFDRPPCAVRRRRRTRKGAPAATVEQRNEVVGRSESRVESGREVLSRPERLEAAGRANVEGRFESVAGSGNRTKKEEIPSSALSSSILRVGSRRRSGMLPAGIQEKWPGFRVSASLRPE